LISAIFAGLPSGPTIVLVSSVIFAVSLVMGRRSVR
jgi:ABC-type Mn2+/Zn2+ transport system permease subunit